MKPNLLYSSRKLCFQGGFSSFCWSIGALPSSSAFDQIIFWHINCLNSEFNTEKTWFLSQKEGLVRTPYRVRMPVDPNLLPIRKWIMWWNFPVSTKSVYQIIRVTFWLWVTHESRQKWALVSSFWLLVLLTFRNAGSSSTARRTWPYTWRPTSLRRKRSMCVPCAATALPRSSFLGITSRRTAMSASFPARSVC